MEAAVAEAYLFQQLQAISNTFGMGSVRKMPWNVESKNTELIRPVIYFMYVGGVDTRPIGPGERTMATLTYEIGVYHSGQSYGYEFKTDTGTVSLFDVLAAIDSALQDYSAPEVQPRGIMLSIHRTSPVDIPSDGKDGTIRRRTGGNYIIHAKA